MNRDGGRAQPGPRFVLAAALVAASFGVAACGGDDEPETTRSPEPPATTQREQPARTEREGEKRREKAERKQRERQPEAAAPAEPEPERRDDGAPTIGSSSDERQATPVR